MVDVETSWEHDELQYNNNTTEENRQHKVQRITYEEFRKGTKFIVQCVGRLWSALIGPFAYNYSCDVQVCAAGPIINGIWTGLIMDDICSMNRDRQLYITCMHFLSVVSVSFNCFVGYVILKHSPSTMNTYKKHLFHYHLMCSIVDVLCTTLAVPVFYMPLLMGYTSGILTTFGMPTWYQFAYSTAFAQYSYILCSFVVFVRMRSVIPESHILSLKGYRFAVFYFCYIILYMTPLVVSMIFVDDQKEKFHKLYSEEFPCLSDVLSNPALLIFDKRNTSINRFLWTHSIFLVVNLLPIGVYVYIALSHLSIHNNNMSTKTRAMQRKMTLHIGIQFLSPAAIISVPLLAMYICGIYRVPGTHFLGYLVGVFLGFHGVISAVVIIIFNAAYFKVFTDLVITPYWKLSKTWPFTAKTNGCEALETVGETVPNAQEEMKTVSKDQSKRSNVPKCPVLI